MKTVWFLRGTTPTSKYYIWWPEVYESEDDATFERDLFQQHAPKGEFWEMIELKVLPDSKTVEMNG